MKKLMLLGVLLLTAITVPVFAKSAATVEKIQSSATSDAKKATQTHDGKEASLTEKASVALNDVISSDGNVVSLKTDDGSTWTLTEKTKFAVRPTEENKAVYELLEGTASYSAADKAGEILVKVNGKNYAVSAGAKVDFTCADKLTELKVIEGTVKFADQVFDKGKTVKVDEQGKATVFKLRGGPRG